MKEELIFKKSKDDIEKEIEKIREKRERNWEKYGKDGFVEIWRKRYKYRGIEYEIACLKYFSFTKDNPLSAGLNKIGKHLVLENTNKEKDLVIFMRNVFNRNNWLWDDTLHADMDWTEEHMEEWLHKRAKEDIDFLLDEAEQVLRDRLKTFQELMREAKK